MHFNSEELDESSKFGSLSSVAKARTETLIKGVPRQSFALSYITLEFESLPKAKKLLTRLWKVTDIGERIANGTEEPVAIPDPEKVTKQLLRYKISKKIESELSSSK